MDFISLSHLNEHHSNNIELSINYNGDGWIGDNPRPKYLMAAYHYAWDYLRFINKEPKLWNEQYGTNTIRASIVTANFLMDEDLSELKAWGQYCPCASPSWRSIIKIDTNAHLTFYQIKHTIRHELAHAIDHQIMGTEFLTHCDSWQKIAQLHEVKTDCYLEYGVYKL